jgi:uncharacterized repeat protein (TIGR03833 family)
MINDHEHSYPNKSEDKIIDYKWFKIGDVILGVREKTTGGFSIRVNQYHLGNEKGIDLGSFKSLLTKILKYYRYQFMTFDMRGIRNNDRGIIQKELNEIGFGEYSSHNVVFQERPVIGDSVLVAIKPYVGRYEKGKIAKVLTGARYHPRGYKVMFANGIVGRIATIVKEKHQK